MACVPALIIRVDAGGFEYVSINYDNSYHPVYTGKAKAGPAQRESGISRALT
jgi:ribosomal protein L31